MIRFKCPTCRKVLKVLDEGAGRKINCPKCGQRLLIPMPAKPAAANTTVLGQLTSSPLPRPAPSTCTEADNLVLLGLRKDAELEGNSEEQSAKSERSWAGALCAILALTLAVAAMPAAVIHHPLLGSGLAAFGVVLALFAVFKSLFRRGLGLAAVALMVGGSVLFSIVVLAGGPEGLLQPVKDRLADLRQQDSQERKEGRSDRPTTPAVVRPDPPPPSGGQTPRSPQGGKGHNAMCPVCLTEFHLDVPKEWTLSQRSAINKRCPFCGRHTDVHTYLSFYQLQHNGKGPGEEILEMNLNGVGTDW